eukprot:5721674-Pyramimonas_sp.AAC.1
MCASLDRPALERRFVFPASPRCPSFVLPPIPFPPLLHLGETLETHCALLRGSPDGPSRVRWEPARQVAGSCGAVSSAFVP